MQKPGAYQLDDCWNAEHGDEDYQHRNVWIFDDGVELESADCNDAKIQHVTGNGDCPSGKKSVGAPAVTSAV